jgi:hypothetical protein
MDTKAHLTREALDRLIKQIDARPLPARLRDPDSVLLAQRIRQAPPPGLRRRISVV